jgi:tRNA(Ile)-lysidine synthase
VWLRRELGDAVPASLLTRLLDELPVCTAARWPCPDTELRLYRGVLRSASKSTSPLVDTAREVRLAVIRAGRHALPGWGGWLQVTRLREAGVPLAALHDLTLRARSGAERFQAGPGRPPRSLKKQYQQAGIPQWERSGPLVYAGDRLVYAAGLGLDARVLGRPGESLMQLAWQPAGTVAASGA